METDVKVLLHSEAQLLDYGESRTSGPWVKLRLPDHSLLDAFRGLDVGGTVKTTPNLHVTIALGDIATLVEDGAPPTKAEHADASALLWRSAFFRNPEVWGALGCLDDCESLRRSSNIKAAQTRAWNLLRETLGYESMADVPPSKVVEWATGAGVVRLLPHIYALMGVAGNHVSGNFLEIPGNDGSA
jgi:hypothetical protein